MKLAVPKEIWPGEKRVAVTPETVKKLKALGFDVAIEAGAGTDAALAVTVVVVSAGRANDINCIFITGTLITGSI